MALSIVSNTLSVDADGRTSKSSPTAGVPLTVSAMPSTWIACPAAYGTLVCAVARPSFSTEYVVWPAVLANWMR